MNVHNPDPPELSATQTARPMQQAFRGHAIVHAAANQQMSVGMGYAAGEALCGTMATIAECEPGLFPPQVTCQRCVTIADAEHVEITEGRL